ncbi:hypothetical protein ACFWMG_04725 [Streptomyces sp. NPDC127074]|uniref:hypothetical protein n=1 Tax=Streptomyces sp. NPDC127074 TaxID=3347130 RepID=UPI00365175B4
MTEDDTPVQPASTGIPIVTSTDGQPFIGCDAVVAFLRSIAEVVDRLDDQDDPRDLAAAIHIEADNLECRAIAHTTHQETR